MGTVFAEFDSVVEGALGSRTAERALAAAYWTFWRDLKRRVGTASGFTGLAEYLFVRFFVRALERGLAEPFVPFRLTEHTYGFRAGHAIITHDSEISRYVPSARKRKPDLCIFAEHDNGARLVAAAQIKIYVAAPANLKSDLGCLRLLGRDSDALLFQILLAKPSVDQVTALRAFCSDEFSHRAFVISEHELGCNASLQDAISMLLQKLREA